MSTSQPRQSQQLKTPQSASVDAFTAPQQTPVNDLLSCSRSLFAALRKGDTQGVMAEHKNFASLYAVVKEELQNSNSQEDVTQLRAEISELMEVRKARAARLSSLRDQLRELSFALAVINAQSVVTIE